METNFYTIILPKALDGSVNRQVYAFTDYDSAKQNFHFNCGKYFKNADLLSASVIIIDDFGNRLEGDYWKKEIPQPEPTPEIEEMADAVEK